MGGSLLLTVLFVGAALLLVNSNETTAVAAFVLQRGDRFPELVNGSLTFLIKQKDGAGRFTPNPK